MRELTSTTFGSKLITTLELTVPPNSVWRLEIRAKPAPAALRHFALFQVLEKADGLDPALVRKARERIRQGLHAAVSSSVTLQIRHCTNRPARAPRKIELHLVPRRPKQTAVRLRGRFEIDVPSTGALIVQAATQISWLDDPNQPLPALPREAMERLVYRAKTGEATTADADSNSSMRRFESELERRLRKAAEIEQTRRRAAQAMPREFWGVASDSAETLEPGEFVVTEHSLESPKYFSLPSNSRQLVEWQQDLADGKHHRVFYRALAVSRFAEFFPPGMPQPCPLPGPFTKTQIEYLVSADQASLGNTEGERKIELFGWHRVEIPATVRPEPPAIREANSAANRARVRICTVEAEIHPSAYPLAEGKHKSLRPTYVESVVLPEESL